MMLIKTAIVALAFLGAMPAAAQLPGIGTEAVAKPPQPGTVALPVQSTVPDKEVWHLDHDQFAVRNVTYPTLTPFLPVGHSTGAAVIVAPGGAFLGLAIEKEGWDVARWLANHGIAAFVLKYRTLHTPPSQLEFAKDLQRMLAGEKVDFAPAETTPPDALADGLAALRYVRAHAKSYGIDPKRVGFMGFSAGGFLTRSVVAKGGADMPDFAAPIYPNMGPMVVPKNAPPMFVAVAADDFLLAREKGFPLIESYREAGRPIEFHMFVDGGHGFATGRPGTTTNGWMRLLLAWMTDRNLLGKEN